MFKMSLTILNLQNKTHFVWPGISIEINWSRNNGSHPSTAEPFDQSQKLA
jgi:hypothetical protein